MMFRFLAAALAWIAALMVGNDRDPNRNKVMINAEWVDRIVRAYGPLDVDESRLRDCYRALLMARREELGTLPEEMVEAVLDGIVHEKCEEVSHAARPERVILYRADRLDVALAPLDRRAYAWASQVLRGRPLDPQQQREARRDLDQLRTLAGDVLQLPEPYQEALAERVSETQLDLIYALENGKGPMSLRLGRETGS